MKKTKTPDTKLSPAERTAKLLAFRGARHNFGTPNDRFPPIPVASSRFKTI